MIPSKRSKPNNYNLALQASSVVPSGAIVNNFNINTDLYNSIVGESNNMVDYFSINDIELLFNIRHNSNRVAHVLSCCNGLNDYYLKVKSMEHLQKKDRLIGYAVFYQRCMFTGISHGALNMQHTIKGGSKTIAGAVGGLRSIWNNTNKAINIGDHLMAVPSDLYEKMFDGDHNNHYNKSNGYDNERNMLIAVPISGGIDKYVEEIASTDKNDNVFHYLHDICMKARTLDTEFDVFKKPGDNKNKNELKHIVNSWIIGKVTRGGGPNTKIDIVINVKD